jgi:hypothetical protein
VTGRRLPPRPPLKPKGFEDVPELSPEEVERRVVVRGGGSPGEPIERPVRRTAPRGPEHTVVRDALPLIGLVIVGLVAASFLLPDGPLSSSTSNPPVSEVAVASATAAAPGRSASPTGTPVAVVETLGVSPAVTEPQTLAPPAPTLAPGVAPGPRVKPGPTAALKPGQTPHPTPMVTPGPTAPNTATLIVKLHVVNDAGGGASDSQWTIQITGEVGSGVSTNNFAGSESGTTVTIPAGAGYLVTDDNIVAGYAVAASADCSRLDSSPGLTAGLTYTCTITRNDIAPNVDVTIAIVGADPPDPPVLQISSDHASQSSITTIGTTAVTLFAGDPYTVSEISGPAGYSLDITGTCSNSGLALGAPAGCTYTYTQPLPSPALPSMFLPIPLLRRWQAIRRR